MPAARKSSAKKASKAIISASPSKKSAKKAPKKPSPSPSLGVLAWDDDPGDPPGRTPSTRPVPKLTTAKLGVDVRGTQPPAGQFPVGTPKFRFWVAAEALRRSADFWGTVVPSNFKWMTGARLPIQLDEGVDLNAYYTRGGGSYKPGLSFFHATIGNQSIFSGESPDVVAHELGHAILDGLRPQLFQTNSAETAAFHESFGDMSALLTALQLKELRIALISESGGNILHSTRISRVAEQLGWGIRQRRPDAVDTDSLRNAVNTFFYRDPIELPPSAPATQLSSAPHSFSRVFTGAFYELLAGMLRVQGAAAGEADLLRVTREAAQLLVDAVLSAPIAPAYFSQIAAHFITADANRFNKRYRDVIKSAFVRRGILSLESATMQVSAPTIATSAPATSMTAALPVKKAAMTAQPLSIPSARYGLERPLRVQAPSEEPRIAVMSAARSVGPVAPPTGMRAAESFVEDLFRQGRIDVGAFGDPDTRIEHPYTRKTHELEAAGNELQLVRRFFDCGFDGH
jgi:hypothetical protein